MPSESTVLVEDLAYLETSSGMILARLYKPQRKGPLPAIVSVHGGRWVSQTRLTNAVIDQALAAAGILVMAIDFRMPPIARYPEPIADINFAIRWLKQAATRFGGRPHLVGALGTSSGGHQVMLNALRPNDSRYVSHPLGSAATAELAFVVACWPVLDPLARYRMAKERNMELHVKSHDLYWPDEAAMHEGNPQLILEGREFPTLPPLLLIQGTADTTVPVEMTQRFAETYAARGGISTLKLFEGRPHTFITNEPELEQSQQAISDIREFIRSQSD